jgi:cytochrome c oxidase cbb3-type subunit I/II
MTTGILTTCGVHRYSAGSIMPGYKWLFDNKLDISDIDAKMKVMQTLGVPYTDAEVANAKNLREIAKLKTTSKDPDFVKSYEESKKSSC